MNNKTKNETTAEKILYTLTGCEACVELKEELVEEIDSGEVEVKECDLNSKNPKVLENCKESMDRHDFDGYPSIYNKDGTKEF